MAIPFSTTATMELLSIGLVLLVHVLGGAALIYLLVRDSGESVRDWWPSDDDDGGPPLLGPDGGTPSGGGDALPLPGAGPSSLRVREGERIAEGYPRPARRPAREPQRAPVPKR
jgi:hypothetical protein